MKTWRDFVNLEKPDDRLALRIDDAIIDGWPAFGQTDTKWIVLDGVLTIGGKKYEQEAVESNIEEYYRRLRMASDLQIICNSKKQIVYMAGKLPDGTLGMVIDVAKPFTELELTDPKQFEKHRDDLAKRVDASMAANDE